MANFNESDSNSSGEDLHSYWSFAGYNIRSEILTGLCPVCLRPGTIFHCSSCVKNGAFMHSRKKCLEGFADKKLNLCKLNERKIQILERYKSVLDKKIKAENVKNDISLCCEKNRFLKECILQTSDEANKFEKFAEDVKSENRKWMEIKNKFRSKIVAMELDCNYLRRSLSQQKIKLRDKKELLKHCVKKKILNLVADVFYISKVENPNSEETFDENRFAESKLSAQFTTYFKEKDNSKIDGIAIMDTLYRVVEATIPGNGDYSAYFTPITDCAESSDAVEEKNAEKNMSEKNAKYSIEAALTYVSHLVMLISYYLDVPVPKQMCFSEFCLSELKRKSFCHKVAKLNANIIYLCLQQNVNPSLLKPQGTIENLLLLLNPEICDLGRSSPIEPTQFLSNSMEDVILKDLLLNDEELEPGWVNLCDMVDLENVPECPYSTPDPAQQMSQGITGATGDLVRSSVAMIWKVATGQK